MGAVVQPGSAPGRTRAGRAVGTVLAVAGVAVVFDGAFGPAPAWLGGLLILTGAIVHLTPGGATRPVVPAADGGTTPDDTGRRPPLAGMGTRVDQILRLAEGQADAIRDSARRDADRIVADARREAAAIVRRARAEAGDAADRPDGRGENGAG